MIIVNTKKRDEIRLDGQQIEQVELFKYLGAVIKENGKLDKEINERMRKIENLFNIVKTTFLGKREVPKKDKN